MHPLLTTFLRTIVKRCRCFSMFPLIRRETKYPCSNSSLSLLNLVPLEGCRPTNVRVPVEDILSSLGIRLLSSNRLSKKMRLARICLMTLPVFNFFRLSPQNWEMGKLHRTVIECSQGWRILMGKGLIRIPLPIYTSGHQSQKSSPSRDTNGLLK